MNNTTTTTACTTHRQRPPGRRTRARSRIQTVDPDTQHWAEVTTRLDHAAAQADTFDASRVDWSTATCRTRKVQMYPTGGRTPLAALDCCRNCPIANECLIDAVKTEAMQQWNVFGIRAGLSASDRIRWICDRVNLDEADQ